MNTTLQVRIDSKTKNAVAKIFESSGLDLSSGVKMYFRHILKQKKVSFPLLTENGFTYEQEAKLSAIIKETEALYKAGKLKTFDSWDEMKKDILSEKD
ncbi:MAG: type II toxin-antitoxin system RelB/DinJ family antitoxin [Candidatus Magasanikbacteria bacterium]